jgi:HECT-domain (ubiquitin-transferase)
MMATIQITLSSGKKRIYLLVLVFLSEKLSNIHFVSFALHYRNFWSIVHELSPQQKRQLLLFVTASDRIPVGGLKELMFVIQRNGPDSDRYA